MSADTAPLAGIRVLDLSQIMQGPAATQVVAPPELRGRGVGRALIDGVYIREALKKGAPDGTAAAGLVLEYLERELERRA